MSETPDWFWKAVETESEGGSVDVSDCDINYLQWSQPGKRGLLLVHGHNAHAHWWDFIAPFFKDEFQTVAMDLSGMGDSGHRDAYSSEMYATEILAVANELKMPRDTVVVAHSFGGMMALSAVAREPERFKGLVLVDSGVRHPDEQKEREPERWARAKIYPDRQAAISRFRLQPAQTCANQFIVDHIARHSVEYLGEEDGWTWKFDEEHGSRMNRQADLESTLTAVTGKIALIYGEQSLSFNQKSAEYMEGLQPQLEVLLMKDAQHHLFLDQPLKFVETLTALLQRWA
jgi:pimeloyl-ACP methyl ester carboxylesterase